MVVGGASCAKSRRALFAKNSNGSREPKNFIFVSESTDERNQGVYQSSWRIGLSFRTSACQAGALT
jgi:hypothetical protein